MSLPDELREELKLEEMTSWIPDPTVRGWEVRKDGEELMEVEKLVLYNEFLETAIVYLQRHEGYDGPYLLEVDGGGEVVLLWAETLSDTLLVGLLEEDRPNLGGRSLCAAGGFAEPGEILGETAARELAEESGFKAEVAPLLGTFVDNRLFRLAPEEDQGVAPFRTKSPFPFSELSEEEFGRYRFETDEGKDDLVFLPWRNVGEKSRDSFAQAATLQLVSELR